jgi:N-acetylglutamate synthase/N-acetylornithine aminotransferase
LRSELLDLYIGDLLLMLEGLPVSFDQNIALQLFSSLEIEFTIDLHLGPSSATMWTCTWHGENA